MRRITNRCAWCNLNNPIYVKYHDEEWGQVRMDDQYLFEMLVLETFQAGLSWECILNKRENFRHAFDGFDLSKMAQYDDEKIERLMLDPGIIRNRAKLRAAVNNAVVYQSIVEECGSFEVYLRSFAGQEIVVEDYTVRTTSPLSDSISADLKKRGMKFVGSTTIYAYLQSIGIINAHGPECDLHINKA